jgi:CRP-like cAMP-binding protein
VPFVSKTRTFVRLAQQPRVRPCPFGAPAKHPTNGPFRPNTRPKGPASVNLPVHPPLPNTASPEDTLVERLAQVHPLEPTSRAALAALWKTTALPKGAILQPPGSLCRNLYFVETGLARIYYLLDGKDVTEHFAFENELIVRAESLFTGQPTTKGIEAVEPTIFRVLPAEPLFALFNDHRDLERLFSLLFRQEHVHVLRRLESLQFKTADERYAELAQEPRLLQRIPLKFIASYLGITQVSLSRIRAGKKSGRTI